MPIFAQSGIEMKLFSVRIPFFIFRIVNRKMMLNMYATLSFMPIGNLSVVKGKYILVKKN